MNTNGHGQHQTQLPESKFPKKAFIQTADTVKDKVADTFQKSAQTITDKTADLQKTATSYVKKNPGTAIVVGLAAAACVILTLLFKSK